MSWKDYLNSLTSLKKLPTKLILILGLLSMPVYGNEIRDSLAVVDSIGIKAEEASLADTSFVMKKVPSKALLRSAVLPGLGQIYNESYWKAPLIWSLLGYYFYGYHHYDGLYRDNRTLFMQTEHEVYRRRRDDYRNQRDLFAVYAGMTYCLNLLDAYVDAHLFEIGFSRERLSLKLYLR